MDRIGALKQAFMFKVADALVRNPEAGHQLYRAIARSLAGRLRRAVGMIAFSRERDTRP
jgi:hypothetical protein